MQNVSTGIRTKILDLRMDLTVKTFENASKKHNVVPWRGYSAL